MRDLSELKVVELKEELRKRGLKVGGLKKELVQRLSEYLEKESNEQPSDDDENERDEDVKIVEPIKTVQSPVSSKTDAILRDKKAFSPKNQRNKSTR